MSPANNCTVGFLSNVSYIGPLLVSHILNYRNHSVIFVILVCLCQCGSLYPLSRIIITVIFYDGFRFQHGLICLNPEMYNVCVFENQILTCTVVQLRIT